MGEIGPDIIVDMCVWGCSSVCCCPIFLCQKERERGKHGLGRPSFVQCESVEAWKRKLYDVQGNRYRTAMSNTAAAV